MSARHVGWELALLEHAGFDESIHTVLHVEGFGWSAAWRAEVWRAEHGPSAGT